MIAESERKVGKVKKSLKMEKKTEKNKSKLESELSAKLQNITIEESAEKTTKNVKIQNCNNTEKSSDEKPPLKSDTDIVKVSNGISSPNHEDETPSTDDFYTQCTSNPLEYETILLRRDKELFSLTYKVYESELELPSIMKLIQKDLSEVRKMST